MRQTLYKFDGIYRFCISSLIKNSMCIMIMIMLMLMYSVDIKNAKHILADD